MLYNRSNTLKSLEWVIMDEIHYLNDTEVCRKSLFFWFRINEFVFLERVCLGRSINYVTRSCWFNNVECNCIECERIRRMGWVRLFLISMIFITYLQI